MLRMEMLSRLILAVILGGSLVVLNQNYPQGMVDGELTAWSHLRDSLTPADRSREDIAIISQAADPVSPPHAGISGRSDTLVRAIDTLAASGVRGIVFSRWPIEEEIDLQHRTLERAAHLAERLLKTWDGHPDASTPDTLVALQALVDERERWNQGHRPLAASMRRAGMVALPITCDGLPPNLVTAEAQRLGWPPDDDDAADPAAPCPPLPAAELLQAAATAGFFPADRTAASRYRSVVPWQSRCGRLVPYLPLAFRRLHTDTGAPPHLDRLAPDSKLRIYLPTAEASPPPPSTSLADLVNGAPPREDVEGRLVVLAAPEALPPFPGARAPSDLSTLVGDLQALAHGTYFVRRPWAQLVETALLALAFALMACPAAPLRRWWWTGWCLLLLAALPLAGYLAVWQRIWIHALPPVAGALAALALGLRPPSGPGPHRPRQAHGDCRPLSARTGVSVRQPAPASPAPLQTDRQAPGPPPPVAVAAPLAPAPTPRPSPAPLRPPRQPRPAVEALPATPPALRPARIGRYEIIRLLGRGAMGSVYLGRDPHINRLTAIKTFRFAQNAATEDIPSLKDKFFREAESAGTLSHPHIVTIYDAGQAEDLAYIAMEYLQGESLWRYVRRERLLPILRVIQLGAQVAEALDYAHGQGIVHRDIKPANLILMPSGDIKITDFGIARIAASSQTQTGIVKGTPYYMSPEQFSGVKVDGRSDIFSLGTTLFQLLTGALPFYAKNPAVLMNQIMNFPHPSPKAINPRVMTPLAAILDRALEKNIESRFPTAGALAACLRELDQRIREARARSRGPN
jgi:hypothetical protein